MSTRLAFAYGTSGSALPLAHACAWCGKPDAERDRLLIAQHAPVSHGLCDGCLTKNFGHLAREERARESTG